MERMIKTFEMMEKDVERTLTLIREDYSQIELHLKNFYKEAYNKGFHEALKRKSEESER